MPGRSFAFRRAVRRRALPRWWPGSWRRLVRPCRATFCEHRRGNRRPAATTDSDGPDRLAAALLEGRSVTVLVSADLLRSPEARATLQQLNNLLQVLRVLGKDPAMQFLFDRANQMGAWDMGVLPAALPGLRAVADDAARTTLERAWGAEIPSEPGADFDAMLELCDAGADGRALYRRKRPPDGLSRPGIREAGAWCRRSPDRAGHVPHRYGGPGRCRPARGGLWRGIRHVHQQRGPDPEGLQVPRTRLRGAGQSGDLRLRRGAPQPSSCGRRCKARSSTRLPGWFRPTRG